jgi:hypothetical protein
MSLSTDLSEQIGKLIEEYLATQGSAPPELRKLVAHESVLPLFSDMGGVLAIDATGEIRSFLWDDLLHGRVESDLRIRNLALFQGTKKYPELAALIEKPDDARVCPHCGGTGINSYAEKLNTDAIVCYCGGLGWIP